jgi:hypothetical protein
MEIIEGASMVDCKPCTTLVDTSSKLSGDTGNPISDPTHYHSLANALQYLPFTHPNISYMVLQVCLHMHDPRKPYMTALKRILRYLQGTLDFGLLLIDHPPPIWWSTLTLIGSGASTLIDPLSGMQSSLVTTSSSGPPSARTWYLTPT